MFEGFSIEQTLSLNFVSLNYDNVSGGALNRSMPLFHTPWATCEDCYMKAEVDAELALEFDAGGVPKLFHAEVILTLDLNPFECIPITKTGWC